MAGATIWPMHPPFKLVSSVVTVEAVVAHIQAWYALSVSAVKLYVRAPGFVRFWCCQALLLRQLHANGLEVVSGRASATFSYAFCNND